MAYLIKNWSIFYGRPTDSKISKFSRVTSPFKNYYLLNFFFKNFLIVWFSLLCFLIAKFNWYFLVVGFELQFLIIIYEEFFLCQLQFIKILLDFNKDIPKKNLKYICNDLGLHDMHISLLCLKYMPPSLMLHHHRVSLKPSQFFLFIGSFESTVCQSSTQI